jgi:hypothetical protein
MGKIQTVGAALGDNATDSIIRSSGVIFRVLWRDRQDVVSLSTRELNRIIVTRGTDRIAHPSIVPITESVGNNKIHQDSRWGIKSEGGSAARPLPFHAHNTMRRRDGPLCPSQISEKWLDPAGLKTRRAGRNA